MCFVVLILNIMDEDGFAHEYVLQFKRSILEHVDSELAELDQNITPLSVHIDLDLKTMNNVLNGNSGYIVVDSYVEYIDHMGDDARAAHAARVSFDRDTTDIADYILNEKDAKLIKYLADHRHTSPFEHSTLSVKITCPLAIRSQIMRHRTFSYNEISRRYTSENIELFNLKSYKKQASKNLQCSTEETIDCPEIAEHLISQAYQHATRTYEMLINAWD